MGKLRDIKTAQGNKPTMSVHSTLTADFSVSRRAAQTRRWKFLQGLETFRNHNQMLVIWDMINDYDYNYDFDYDNEYTWTFMQGLLTHFVVIILCSWMKLTSLSRAPPTSCTCLESWTLAWTRWEASGSRNTNSQIPGNIIWIKLEANSHP